MATQTGSIDLTATNGVKLFAAAGFKTAEKTYATKSELEVASDAIELRVTKEEFDSLSIGGRNLLRNGDFVDGTAHWTTNSSGVAIEVTEEDDYRCLHVTGGSITGATGNHCVHIEWSTEYTYHCWIKLAGVQAIGPSTPLHYWFYRGTTRDEIGATNGGWKTISEVAYDGEGNAYTSGNLPVNTWLHLVVSAVTADKTTKYDYLNFRPFIYGGYSSTTSAEYWVRGFKLEKGNKATDWTPAPEDMATASRMSAAETSISQNAEQIALRATKTEAYQSAQPNLSPFFESAPYRTTTSYDGTYWQATDNNWLMSGVTQLTEGWAHVEVGASKRIEVAVPLIESLDSSKTYTLMFEWRNITVTGGPNLYARNYPNNCQFTKNTYNCSWNTSSPTSGVKYVSMTVDTTAKAQAWQAAIDLGMANGSGVSFVGDLRLSLYEGEYSGPYKPYSGDVLYATQAELKVTADGISSEVSKKVGNNEIISKINQSAETVKIQASKVEITGDAVFSAINNDTGTTKISGGKIDATSITIGGSSLATQADVDSIEVGGRNLFKNSASLETVWSMESATVADGVATITKAASGNSRFYQMPANGYWSWVAGETYTVSIDAKGDNDGCILRLYPHSTTGAGYKEVTLTTEWARYAYTFTVATAVTGSMGFAVYGTTGDVVQLRYPKLEHGTRATDWTPAPEDTDSAISTKLDASYNRIWYAECSTVAATTAKVATITPTTTSFTLVKGQTVNVLFSATNTGAVGSLTLNVNNTGAKAIKYLSNGALANLPAANYLRINQIVTFTYDGTYWVADFSYDSDTYNRTRWQNAVKILEKPTGTWRMLCGTSSGYKQVAKGISFDLSYPLLAFSNQPAANATADTGYLSVNSLTYSNTAAIQSGAANKTIYLKGTVNGNTFTIDGTNVFTTVIPTSEDGRCYIPLGIMTSATVGYFKSSKDLYAYVDGAFGPVSIREASAASKTATNYISLHPTDGIKIANANPATATTYQHLTATATEFVVEGDSMLELDGTNGARVGKEDGINTCVGSGGFYIRDSNDVRAGFEYEAASGSTPGNTTIESSDGLKLYGNVSSIDGTETGKTYVLLSGIRYNRDSEKASVAIVANSDPDNSSGDGNGSHIASIHLDGGNTSGDSIPSGEPRATIHVGDESFDIGKPTSLYSTGSVSVANQSWVSVANLTIPSTGTWMVVVTGDFAANATGRRVVGCQRGNPPSSTPAYDSQNSLIMAPVNGAPTKFNSSAIIDFDKNDVYYAGVWQNSGSALTTRIMIKAVRLI